MLYRMSFASSRMTSTLLDCFCVVNCYTILSLAVVAFGGVRQINTAKHLIWMLLVICNSTPSQAFILDWGDCGTGLSSLKVWPECSAQELTQQELIEQSEQEGNQVVTINSRDQIHSLHWTNSTNTVHWLCNGMVPDRICTNPSIFSPCYEAHTRTMMQSSVIWVISPLLLRASHCLC